MPDATALERLLRRDRAIAIVGIGALCVLAWIYIVSGAGLGMSAADMSSFAPFPHQRSVPMLDIAMPGMPDMEMSGRAMSETAPASPPAWSPGLGTLMIAMWWTMMIAMMSPAAAPAILLYARVHRHAISEAG